MKRLLLLLLMVGPAYAQSPVRTLPYAVASADASSTITVTNTFQSIWLGNSISPNTPQRAGCTVQNNGTHTMYVFFGPIASATTSNAFQLAAGQAIYCTVGGIALQSQVSITGTSGDAFTAAQQ